MPADRSRHTPSAARPILAGRRADAANPAQGDVGPKAALFLAKAELGQHALRPRRAGRSSRRAPRHADPDRARCGAYREKRRRRGLRRRTGPTGRPPGQRRQISGISSRSTSPRNLRVQCSCSGVTQRTLVSDERRSDSISWQARCAPRPAVRPPRTFVRDGAWLAPRLAESGVAAAGCRVRYTANPCTTDSRS